MDVDERLRQVCAAAGLVATSAPRLVESYSNDAWLLDDARLGAVVLRVGWRGDITRLDREAAVLQHTPDRIPRPEMVGHGRLVVDDIPLGYTLTRRIPGQSLADVWTSLPGAQRRSAVGQVAEALREFHRWQPPRGLVETLQTRPAGHRDSAGGIVGADIVPLPVARAVALAQHTSGMPHVDTGIMLDAINALEDLRDLDIAIDDPARHGLVHGDLHLHNLWWSEPGTVTMLDFEWVRFAPPDLELQPLCDIATDNALAGRDTYPTVIRWLASDYPELFQVPDLPARLRLYSLAYAIRQIVIHPPDRPAGALPPNHPIHRLRRLLDARRLSLDSWWPA